MNLESMIPGKANTKVLVNGNTYDIGPDCVAMDVAKEDAEKLLQNPNWTIWDGQSNKKTPSGHKRAEAKMKLVNSQGEEVPGQKPPTLEEVIKAGYSPEAAAEIVATEQAVYKVMTEDGLSREDAVALVKKAMEEQAGQQQQQDGSTPPPPPADTSGGEDDQVEDPPLPGEDDEDFDWANPDVRYSTEWLRACADAYEVKPANLKDKAKLVEKIKAAMYE